jgi:DmsE family decaheme c-type cytochrome
MRLSNWVFGALCGAVVTLTTLAAQAQTTVAAPGEFAPRGADACLRCHDQAPVTHVLQTPHAMQGDARTPFAAHACESCHGASPQHMAAPPQGQKRIPPAVVFAGPNASPPEERNKVCIGCHESGLRMNWQGSQHATNDVACVNCHTVHAIKDKVLVKASQPPVCFTCHVEQRAQSFQYSHHPIREGKVVCSDCHNPHGSPGPKMLKEVRVVDTCFTCHAEKRGPLLFEHEPVREDCTNCHNPHGSVQARLLKERLPYLCENCHGGNGGHNGAPFAGQNLPNANNVLNAGRLLQVPQFQINAQSCISCHSQIHGSNSPGGLFFTR